MLCVSDIMSVQLITLSPSDSIKAAREIMKVRRIRHLPVVTELNEFVGLLSERDILKASVSNFADLNDDVRDQIEEGIPVAEAMSTEVVTILPQAPLTQAGEILLKYKFGCLPVLENGQLCGILTETDFLKLALRLIDEKGQAK